ncbi:hypothetical protein QQ045_009334 [Rhodiola kirilowii]
MVIHKINVSKIVQRRRSLAVVLLFSFFISLFLLCLSAFSTSLTTKASILIAHFNPVASMRSFLVDESSGEDLAAYTISERSLRMAESETTSDWTSKLSSCDLFDGQWVVDDAYPIYKPISCPYVDKAFDCFKNGRPDSGFLKLRWRPRNCDIPRFNGTKMLQLLRGKRLVFVGDSLNRNMWESLICAVSESLDDQKKVVQVSGKREFNTVGFYSFKFKDYNCSIDFVRSPFLVKELQRGSKSETLRIDMIDDKAEEYREADIIVFNSGHWWTHSKTKKGKNFFQEGDHIYSSLPVNEAYLKAMRTWAKWVDANIDPDRTRVFFRGYSASHFKGGQWNSGGNCHGEKRPVANEADLAPYPWMMTRVAERVIAEMKTHVFYLNITKMTSFRKDGHPSIFRPFGKAGKAQDCSHWCLPGVPDSWNELLYAALVVSH